MQVRILFRREVTKEHWQNFCSTMGMTFCPNVYKNNVFMSKHVEVVLGAEGVETESGAHMPPYFQSLVIRPVSISNTEFLHVYIRRILFEFPGLIGEGTDPKFVSQMFSSGYKFSKETIDGFHAVWPLSKGASEEAAKKSIERIREAISKSLQASAVDNLLFGLKPSDEITRRMIESASRNHSQQVINLAKRNMTILDGSVQGSRVVVETWKTVYPALWRRLIAMFSAKILRLPQVLQGKPGWKKLLGYQECVNDVGDSEIEFMSRLRVPISYVETDINIVPNTPIREVKIQFKVSKDGAEFGQGNE